MRRFALILFVLPLFIPGGLQATTVGTVAAVHHAVASPDLIVSRAVHHDVSLPLRQLSPLAQTRSGPSVRPLGRLPATPSGAPGAGPFLPSIAPDFAGTIGLSLPGVGAGDYE